MKRAVSALLVSCAIVGIPRHALAEARLRTRSVVAVAEPACAVRLVDLDQYTENLRVELDAAGFALSDGSAASATEAAMTVLLETTSCDQAATSVDLTVTDRATGRSAHRTVPVWDLEMTTRARTVALVSAEIVRRGTWREVAVAEAAPAAASSVVVTPGLVTVATAPVVATAPEVRDPGSSRPPSTELPRARADIPAGSRSALIGVAFEYRAFPGEHTSTVGARVGGRFRPGHAPLELALDGGAASGSEGDPLGVVRVFSASAGIGVAHVTEAGIARVAVGPVLEAGLGHVQGDAVKSAVSDSRTTFIASAALDVGPRFQAFPGSWITLDVLGGWCLTGLRGFADERAVAGMVGAFGALRVGVAAGP